MSIAPLRLHPLTFLQILNNKNLSPYNILEISTNFQQQKLELKHFQWFLSSIALLTNICWSNQNQILLMYFPLLSHNTQGFNETENQKLDMHSKMKKTNWNSFDVSFTSEGEIRKF